MYINDLFTLLLIQSDFCKDNIFFCFLATNTRMFTNFIYTNSRIRCKKNHQINSSDWERQRMEDRTEKLKFQNAYKAYEQKNHPPLERHDNVIGLYLSVRL